MNTQRQYGRDAINIDNIENNFYFTQSEDSKYTKFIYYLIFGFKTLTWLTYNVLKMIVICMKTDLLPLF